MGEPPPPPLINEKVGDGPRLGVYIKDSGLFECSQQNTTVYSSQKYLLGYTWRNDINNNL